MAKHSAGILLYRRTAAGPEVLLVHPGGPFWVKKDDGAWSIPKGEIGAEEVAAEAARREFAEETGFAVSGPLTELGEFRQPSGKRITAFALAGDADPALLSSNSCLIEWPRKSGRLLEIPEVDRAAWFTLPEGLRRIIRGQRPILEAFAAQIGAR